MSPVFGHGRLRLYLLRLLEESPKHGYEMIRLLQDRFLGVYSPSPGTIYPRLARLEAEGLVSHEVMKGKKVYTLTDKGRAELERRMDELAELEEEISASAQRFAREVQEDVRHTVRSLREELTQAAREMRGREHGGPEPGAHERSGPEHDGPEHQEPDHGEPEHQEPDHGERATGEASRGPGQRTTGEAGWGDGERHREEWRRQKQQWREHTHAWTREWRRSWDDAWKDARKDAQKDARKTAAGSPDEIVRLKLEGVLRRFVEEVRAATREGGSLDETRLAAARALLDDTLRRLREDVLKSARPSHPSHPSDTPPTTDSPPS